MASTLAEDVCSFLESKRPHILANVYEKIFIMACIALVKYKEEDFTDDLFDQLESDRLLDDFNAYVSARQEAERATNPTLFCSDEALDDDDEYPLTQPDEVLYDTDVYSDEEEPSFNLDDGYEL